MARRDSDMTVGNIWKHMISFSVPMAVGLLFRQIYLAVTKALGAGFIAVALAYPVGWILCSALLIIRYSKSALVRGPGP